MHPTDLLPHLKRLIPGASDVAHVTEYEIDRELPSGGSETVIVRVFDSGPSRSDMRYAVTASSKDGKYATGNPADSPDLALALVHWDNLDK
jgi:hypothetical protein